MFDSFVAGLRKLSAWKPLAQEPPPNSNPTDSYFQKLVTYIPADIIAAWVALSGVVSQAGTSTPSWLSWAVFGGLLVLTPFYVCYLKTQPPGLSSSKIFHTSTSCVAFVSWVFALGGPFATLSWYLPVYGSVVLVFVTLTIPVVESHFVKAKGGDAGSSGGGGGGGGGGNVKPSAPPPAPDSQDKK